MGQVARMRTYPNPAVTHNYSSATKYLMYFEKGQLPPARGFWSLTMYDGEHFFVDTLTAHPRPMRQAGAESGRIDITRAESP